MTRGRLVGFLLTGLFLVLAARNVDLAAVGRELAAADYRLLIPAAACTLTGYLLRTLRWGAILRPVQPAAFPTLFSALMLGFAANNILPARVGEVVRAYTLGRKTGAPVSLGFATINRNLKAFALAIVGAEYVLRLLPRGTHEYEKLVKPSELARFSRDAGLSVRDIVGMTYNPFTKVYALGRDTDVNYILHANRA